MLESFKGQLAVAQNHRRVCGNVRQALVLAHYMLCCKLGTCIANLSAQSPLCQVYLADTIICGYTQAQHGGCGCPACVAQYSLLLCAVPPCVSVSALSPPALAAAPPAGFCSPSTRDRKRWLARRRECDTDTTFCAGYAEDLAARRTVATSGANFAVSQNLNACSVLLQVHKGMLCEQTMQH